jgi:hypothetical protein
MTFQSHPVPLHIDFDRTNGAPRWRSRQLIGRAAYREAVRLYPGDLIELRHGARVIEKSCGPHPRFVQGIGVPILRDVTTMRRLQGYIRIKDFEIMVQCEMR